MSTPQPIDDQDRASLDGMDGVFSDETTADTSVEKEAGEKSSISGAETSTESDTEVGSELNQEAKAADNVLDFSPAQGEEVGDDMREESATTGTALSHESSVEEDLADSLVDGQDKVSRSDLISLLEGFVGILRKDGNLAVSSSMLRNRNTEEELKFTDVDIEDKTAELEEMRRLVIEAQETIIKLLTDRVEDRAKIASLETELKLLPDLQEQADRAMAVAFKTEEFRTELHRVKYELEKNRIAAVRRDMYKGPRGVLTRVQRWILKARGRSQLKFNDALREESKK